jgi:hypothetical protein
MEKTYLDRLPKAISPIIVVGTYERHRGLARGVKGDDPTAHKRAAEELAPFIPTGASLIPIPSSSGDTTANLVLCRAIQAISKSPIADILRGEPRGSNYKQKADGPGMLGSEIQFHLIGPVPSMPFLVDNVIDTGATLKAAYRTLGCSVGVVAVAFSGQPDERAASAYATQETESAWFRRWFRNSKIMDPSGRPLVCYHGTESEFDTFQTPAYFASSQNYGYIRNSPVTLAVYLRIENPYMTEDQNFIECLRSFPDRVAKLKKQGYDGVVYANPSDLRKGPSGWGNDYAQIVAFYPEQIKAVANSGAFNPEDDRFSRNPRR